MTEDKSNKTMEAFFDTETGETQQVMVSEENDDVSILGKGKKAGEAGKKNNKATVDSDDLSVVEDIDEHVEANAGNEGNDDDGTNEELEGKDTKKTPSKSKASSSSSSPSYSVLAKALFEEGVISEYDEGEFNELVETLGSPAQAVIELNKRTIANAVEEYKNSLTSEQQEYLDALKNGVPHETISSLQSLEAQYNGITNDAIDADEDLAKSLFTQYLSLKGFSADEIKEEIKDKEAVGKIKTVGKQALTVLKKHIETLKQQEVQTAADAKQAEIDSANNYVTGVKTKVNALNEIIPGQKLSAKLKAEIVTAITAPTFTDKKSGRSYNLIGQTRMKDPVDFDIKLAYLIKTGMFNGDLKIAKVNAKSSAINELDEVINNSHKSGSLGGGKSPSKVNEINNPKSTEMLQSLGKLMKNKKQV